MDTPVRIAVYAHVSHDHYLSQGETVIPHAGTRRGLHTKVYHPDRRL